jgi:hypothetical protein
MAKRGRWPGQTPARQALNCICDFVWRAMYLEGHVDLSVSSRLLPDGSCVISILHPEGTFQFAVPKAERDAHVERMRNDGPGQLIPARWPKQ